MSNNMKSYKEVLAHLEKSGRQKHLLLGNGFSMSYDHNIFSYNALSNYINNTEDELLKKLFRIINTTNFEVVMRQLDIFYQLSKDFLSNEDLSKKILTAGNSLKNSLMSAITELHPEHVFNVPQEKSIKCAEFLQDYLNSNGHVFTTNYDLLLYWVLMRNKEHLQNTVDGFGREPIEQEEYKPDSEPEFGDLEWGPNVYAQHIYYLHGALHIFDSGTSIIKEIYDGVDCLLSNIMKRIESKEYPVFVTAGNGNQKKEHILHNQYLDYCYKQLSSVTGSLITYGFGFGDYDRHIIEAINKAASQKKDHRLWSIYIGVYSDDDIKHIEAIKSKFKCKVNMFDVKTVNIWS
ncbi:DUF4917 family protein [Candidatus Margulisiibacteriota bacterium]